MWRQLKAKRKKLQLKQAEVCQGLCSVSYYSKIENGRVVPDENLASALRERLQIGGGITERHQENNLTELLQLHKDLLADGEELTLPSLTSDAGKNEKALLLVLKLRQLISKPYLSVAAWRLYRQAEKERPADSRVRFLLYKARGILYYMDGWPEHASLSLLQACCAAGDMNQPSEEMADLHLHTAQAMLESENGEGSYLHAASCIRMAAETGDMVRCTKAMEIAAEALFMTGLKQEGDHELMLLQQHTASEAGERTSLMKGRYFRQRGKTAEAAAMLQRSYRSRKGMDRLEVIYELVHVFLEMEMYEDARTWTAHAQATIHEFETSYPLSSRDVGWKHLFMFLASLCSQHSQETKKIVVNILPYFETCIQWKHCLYFYNWLADHALAEKDLQEALYWRTKAGNKLSPE
ncbi:helix-turn-helix transcriptional regulator [Bacillus luteus]|uniref:Helix-turn-helix transcriptional regulator n=1 Tax=Alkalicoccus luteus TaxID=1237094 RepID=A0A969TUI0_9BACI|nr:helix-turn-helix transcriptional regulator [Alkalicoccus luteus]